MAPVLPEGIYIIRNAQYCNYVAANFDPDCGGPIVASSKYSSDDKYHKWKIGNVKGSDGVTDYVVIESMFARECVASVKEYAQGVKLFAMKPEFRWNILWILVEAGCGKYYLRAADPDVDFEWQLPSGADGVQFEIIHHTGGDDTKWSFESVPN